MLSLHPHYNEIIWLIFKILLLAISWSLYNTLISSLINISLQKCKKLWKMYNNANTQKQNIQWVYTMTNSILRVSAESMPCSEWTFNVRPRVTSVVKTVSGTTLSHLHRTTLKHTFLSSRENTSFQPTGGIHLCSALFWRPVLLGFGHKAVEG